MVIPPSTPAAPAPAPGSAGSAASKAPSGAAQAAQFEALRRKELTAASSKAVNEANKLVSTGEMEQIEAAITRYQFVLNSLQPSGDMAPVYQRAAYGLAAALVYKAQAALKDGKVPEAVALYEQAKTLNPTSSKILEQLAIAREQLKEYEEAGKRPASLVNNPAWNPEFKERVATVQMLFFEGDRLYDTGQYDKAENRYYRILALDPYNKAAREKLERLERAKFFAATEMRKLTRAQAMLQVTEGWEEKVPFDFGMEDQDSDEPSSTPSKLKDMYTKLERIVIPRITFDQLDIQSAVQFLQDKSRELDPDNAGGVNFVLKLDRTSLPGVPAADAQIVRQVTLDLNNVPLLEALRLLSTVTRLQLQIEEYAVYLLPPNDQNEVLITRTYSVPVGFIRTSINVTAEGTATPDVKSVQVDAKEELINKGVSFPDGATAAFLRSSSKLVVKNTPQQLDIIQALIDAERDEQPQVEIETKFAEFTDDALKALTINWYVSGNRNLIDVFSPLIYPNIQATLAPLLGSVAPFNPAVPDTLIPNVPVPVNPFGLNSLQGRDPAFFNTSGTTTIRTPANIPFADNAGPGGITPNSLDFLLGQNSLSALNPALAPRNWITGGVLGPNQFNTLAVGGVIGGNGVAAVIDAVDNLRGVDLLSAPKVTTKNRNPAKIEVIRELRYPTEFERPQIAAQTFAIDVGLLSFTTVLLAIPATPREFEVRNIGVTLDVTPTTYADQRIDLDITPEIVDFEGFINYGQPIVQRQTSANPNTEAPAVVNGIVNQPVFNVRKLTTKLQVLDGQTIVMGGLMREDRQEILDKIPFLGDLPIVGRAFQGKTEKSFKRNLIIFVTSRLMKSDGTPLYSRRIDEKEPEYKVSPGLTPPPQAYSDEPKWIDDKNFIDK
jgi:general secretion pathway protein D